MQVILRREGENAQVHLTGRALGAGRMGDRVVVQAGLGMTRLTGIVRGAGVVELPQKVGQ
jgi:flagella basal body P-ring formation protein FlgA